MVTRLVCKNYGLLTDLQARPSKLTALPLRGLPEGASDNSPAFQRRVIAATFLKSPGGSAEIGRLISSVPPGLLFQPPQRPSVETLGYFRLALRANLEVKLS